MKKKVMIALFLAGSNSIIFCGEELIKLRQEYETLKAQYEKIKQENIELKEAANAFAYSAAVAAEVVAAGKQAQNDRIKYCDKTVQVKHFDPKGWKTADV